MKNRHLIMIAAFMLALFITLDKTLWRTEPTLHPVEVDRYVQKNDSVLDLVDETIERVDDLKKQQRLTSSDKDSLARLVLEKDRELYYEKMGRENERKQYLDSLEDLKRQKQRVIRLPSKSRKVLKTPEIKRVNLPTIPDVTAEEVEAAEEMEVEALMEMISEPEPIAEELMNVELDNDQDGVPDIRDAEPDTIEFRNKRAERLYNQFRKAQGWD